VFHIYIGEILSLSLSLLFSPKKNPAQR
jgi:hypothetical protein